jgi:DNA polymerase-3 subunit epsilon
MRQIVLDTETTGLVPSEGHRVIEIGAVEMNDRRLTSRRFHCYLNPDRRVDIGALEVHGISDEFLSDKPRFADVVDEFLSFIDGGELVIHNAPFDVGFLDNELQLLNGSHGCIKDYAAIVDTLEMARAMHPGMKNSLDALCRRYEVDNSHRNLHGALLDAQILAEVYLLMTGGQTTLSLAMSSDGEDGESIETDLALPPVRIVLADEQENKAHQERLAHLERAASDGCLWGRSDKQ